MSPRTRLGLCVVLSAVTPMLLAGLGEWATRLVFRDITTTGDYQSFFARAWKRDHVRLNALGFRDRARPRDRFGEPGYRIAVIGDSFTFGQGIPEADRFTDLLERRLNGSTRRYEVLNLGRPGAATVDELVTLRDVLTSSPPDYVLLQWFVDDVETTRRSRERRPTARPLIPVHRLHARLHEHSALYFLLNRGWRTLQEDLGISESYETYMLRRFEHPTSVDSIEYRQTLQAFVDLCKARGTPMGIVLFPDQRGSVSTIFTIAFCRCAATSGSPASIFVRCSRPIRIAGSSG